METPMVRGESAKQSREKRGSLDRKPKFVKLPVLATDLLAELVSLRKQTPDFFVKERGLCGLGLNPRLASDMTCMTAEKVEEVWGKCTSFKTTNMTLTPETRSELLQLYAKIYGKMEVTNSEFMAWVVKGHIAEIMGFEVDWASAAASTALVLASRVEGELMRRELSSNEVAELLPLAPHAMAKATNPGAKTASLSTVPSECERRGSFSRLKTGVPSCALGATPTDVANAEEVLRVEEELLVNTSSKERFLELSKKLIQDKIIGFKFGMNERKADATEAKESVNDVQEGLKKIDLQIAEF
jgi:hypothetical protein